MRQKTPTVSVIIPVYNEEDRIYDCLYALTQQTVAPLEIIVVDNNSTDQTAIIAAKFIGVQVLHEQKQGISHARNKGFNYAKGTVLARIDADAIVASDWIYEIKQAFRANKSLDAITGYGKNRAGLNANALSVFYSWAYFVHSKAFFGTDILWGSNMAVRKELWQKIEPLCTVDNSLVHEDQDISLAAACLGANIKIVPSLMVSVDYGDVQYFDKFWRYYRKQYTTRSINKNHPRYLLDTRKSYSLLHRATFEMLSWYSVPSYFAITITKSSIRSLVTLYLNSSIYWWYQKIKSDISA